MSGRKDVNSVNGNLSHLFDNVLSLTRPLGLDALKLQEVCGFSAKILVALHGHDMSSYIKNKGLAVYDELFKKGDLLLPISEHWKQRLVEMGCPPGGDTGGVDGGNGDGYAGVAKHHSGIPELVVDGVSGIRVSSHK